MDTIFGLGAAAFYFYMVIDSYQTARAKLLGQPVPGMVWLGRNEDECAHRRRAPDRPGRSCSCWTISGVHVFSQIGKYWPVLLIVFGVLLLQRRMGGGGGTPPVPPAGPQIAERISDGPDEYPGTKESVMRDCGTGFQPEK